MVSAMRIGVNSFPWIFSKICAAWMGESGVTLCCIDVYDAGFWAGENPVFSGSSAFGASAAGESPVYSELDSVFLPALTARRLAHIVCCVKTIAVCCEGYG